ncbi:MAG: molecular chaperone DnaK, partial [bacterium]
IGIDLNIPTVGDQTTVVCVLPRGTEEGSSLVLDSRRFELQANLPVSFTLWSSTSRQGDMLGGVITTNVEDLHPHSPLVTVIRFGKRSTNINIPVKVVTKFTEVGTLEIWCESQVSEHRWRLQFQLRKDTAQIRNVRNVRKDTGLLIKNPQIIADEAIEKANTAIFQVFGSTTTEEIGKTIDNNPVELLGKLEETLGVGRDSWPLEIIRKLSDYLIEVSEGRQLGEKFEARWLNLYGFCLRPGFGDPVDDWRLQQARKLYHRGLYFLDDEQCQAEWLVLWRRVCGGFTKGQQIDFYERYASQLLGSRTRKRVRLNQQVERESWRALASMELLPIQNKIELGNALISRIQQGQMGENEFWSLGRIGARIPFYATIDTVVSPAVVTRWIDSILTINTSQDAF